MTKNYSQFTSLFLYLKDCTNMSVFVVNDVDIAILKKLLILISWLKNQTLQPDTFQLFDI